MSGELELVGEDRLVVTKQATDDLGRQALAHEAMMLERAAHPGVVELVSFEDDGELALLRTEFAGEQTWQVAPPSNVGAVGQGIASLAATLADLHDLGVVHRGIDEDHVIVAPAGRLVLCDLRTAGDHDPAIDVDQLGAMLTRRLDDCEPTTSSLRLFNALQVLATDATHDDPSQRISARQFATSVATAMESWRPTVGQQHRPKGALAQVRIPRSLPISNLGGRHAAAAAAVGMALGALLLFGGSSASDPIATLPVATTLLTEPPTTSAPSVEESATTTPPATSAKPLVIEHEGFNYAVGTEGDVVATGDWDCDGAKTAAVLRPGSGNLYVFSGWPAPGESAIVQPMVVPDATTNVTAAGLCGHVGLIDAAGGQVNVPVTVR